jgi:ABC-2 type transport system permease protein
MLVLSGVFGSHPDPGYDMRRPDDYYVAASVGVPVIALALVGLPVTLASYRERGILTRLEAFGVSKATVVAAQAVVTAVLVVLGAAVVLGLALPTYGVPRLVHPAATIADAPYLGRGAIRGSGHHRPLARDVGAGLATGRACGVVGRRAGRDLLARAPQGGVTRRGSESSI